MNTPLRRITAILCVTATLTGCQTVNTAQRSDPVGERNLVDDQRIVTDLSLAQVAQVVSINEARVANGRLKVQAQLRNKDRRQHTIHYRFEWLDREGIVQNSITSSWKSVSLEGRQTRSIAATATHPDVVDFRLELIEREPLNAFKNR